MCIYAYRLGSLSEEEMDMLRRRGMNAVETAGDGDDDNEDEEVNTSHLLSLSLSLSIYIYIYIYIYLFSLSLSRSLVRSLPLSLAFSPLTNLHTHVCERE